eukprot:3465238-Rhodomonas_salina.1
MAWAAKSVIMCKRIISRELEQSVFQLLPQALLLGGKAMQGVCWRAKTEIPTVVLIRPFVRNEEL